MRLVLVEWLDSYGCSSEWQRLEGQAPQALHCRSVGWLYHDGEECKVIIPHLSDSSHAHTDQQGCGDMTIPSPSILRMVDLNIPIPA